MMLSRTNGFLIANCFLCPEVNMWGEHHEGALNPSKCRGAALGEEKEGDPNLVSLHMSHLIHTFLHLSTPSD